MGQLDDYSLLESASDVGHLASPLAFRAHVLQARGKPFRARAHQKVISDAIVDAFLGRGPRFVAISIGQQYDKTQIASIGAAEWILELHTLGVLPGGLVGLMSYEDSLAQSWSRTIRQDIEAVPDAFNTRLRKDSRAVSEWWTEADGGVLAIGTGGSVQGRPLTLFGIDDPTKNYEQAMSPAHQDRIWNNWVSVFYGRLQPWTVVLVTMVRWAPDDFIGRLASEDYEGDPKDWRFINIPLVANAEDDPLGREIGEPLIRPQAEQTIEQAKLEAERIQISVSTYSWQTNWQQDPRDAEGTILAESKWRVWGGDFPKDAEYDRIELPLEFDQVVMSWDMSFKDLKTSDWVVGTAWGRIGADYYLIDLVRGRWSFTETCNRVNTFAKRIRYVYKNATAIVVEDKANGPAVIDQLRSKVGGLVDFDPSDYGSKLARAHAIQPFQLGGNIYIPAESEKPWVRLFKKELADFRGTGRETDDQVDSTTMGILHMTKYQFSPAYVESGEDIDLTNLHATDVR